MLVTLFVDHEPPGCSPAMPLPDRDHEPDLLILARSGDKDAFAALTNRYRRVLRTLALRVTGSHEQAEDAVQETMLKAYLHLPQFEARARFSTWISRIAVNEALSSLRKHKYTALPLEEMSAAEESRALYGVWRTRLDDPESLYARREVYELLTRALNSLMPQNRAVFVLTQLRGWSIQEVAEQLQVTEPAVKARVYRARKQLREKLGRIAGVCR